MKHKKTIIASIIFLVLFFSTIFIVFRVKTQVKDLFRMNKELQEEIYYMGDFEFKMMGIVYWLDKGHYFKALSKLNNYHHQLQTKEGVIKVPKFFDKEEELEFYLNLQNPKTGAFIDDSYPYPVYNEITENVVDLIASLSKEIGRPVQLKYPLKYLDEINTPEKLTAFLDDTAYVSWIAMKFPQTPYVFARSILSHASSEGAIAENNLYVFSPEWKRSMLEWFYENQDSKTGFWGPRSRTNHKLLKKDLTNTASIIKAFVDLNGNNIYENFPLRYKDKMFGTTLEVLSEPKPDDEEQDEMHEWNLKMGKGISMLTRYLLKNASGENRDEAKNIIGNYIRIKFQSNYIPKDGAFGYYPNEEHASLDGMGNFSLFKDLGAFSKEKQSQLWGETAVDLGTREISEIDANNFAMIANIADVNSIRIYKSDPESDYLKDIAAVFYPKNTTALDIADLTPKVKNWLETTPSTMGNWTSRETALQNMEVVNTEKVPVYENGIPLEEINEILNKNDKIVAIGFDVLQIPRDKMTFKLKR